MGSISSYKKRSSDRSGFDSYENELVKDGPYLVEPDEYDAPAPSKRSLGGEGDISGEPRADSEFSTSITMASLERETNPTVCITAAGGITPSFVHPFMRVSGSNNAIDITADPQIALGKEGQVLTLVCVDSSITLDHGAGLNLMASAGFVMRSGAIITLYYSSGGTVWNETSRYQP